MMRYLGSAILALPVLYSQTLNRFAKNDIIN